MWDTKCEEAKINKCAWRDIKSKCIRKHIFSRAYKMEEKICNNKRKKIGLRKRYKNLEKKFKKGQQKVQTSGKKKEKLFRKK